MTTLELMTVEVVKRGSDMNCNYVAPLRGLIVYILPGGTDVDLDKIRIEDKLICLVDTTHMICRDKRK